MRSSFMVSMAAYSAMLAVVFMGGARLRAVAGQAPLASDGLVLLAYTVVFAGLAAWRYRRAEARACTGSATRDGRCAAGERLSRELADNSPTRLQRRYWHLGTLFWVVYLLFDLPTLIRAPQSGARSRLEALRTAEDTGWL